MRAKENVLSGSNGLTVLETDYGGKIALVLEGNGIYLPDFGHITYKTGS
jgi:hypothetical protein